MPRCPSQRSCRPGRRSCREMRRRLAILGVLLSAGGTPAAAPASCAQPAATIASLSATLESAEPVPLLLARSSLRADRAAYPDAARRLRPRWRWVRAARAEPPPARRRVLRDRRPERRDPGLHRRRRTRARMRAAGAAAPMRCATTGGPSGRSPTVAGRSGSRLPTPLDWFQRAIAQHRLGRFAAGAADCRRSPSSPTCSGSTGYRHRHLHEELGPDQRNARLHEPYGAKARYNRAAAYRFRKSYCRAISD